MKGKETEKNIYHIARASIAISNLSRAVKNIVLKTEYIYHIPRELILHSTYFALWNKFSSIGIWYIFRLQNNWYFSLLVIIDSIIYFYANNAHYDSEWTIMNITICLSCESLMSLEKTSQAFSCDTLCYAESNLAIKAVI